MPFSILAYREADGTIPAIDWLNAQPMKVQAKFSRLFVLLGERGQQLHRPHADLLRDDIHELRVREGSVNYRMLYFFSGREIVILSHGLTKEDRVNPKDIDLAIERKQRF